MTLVDQCAKRVCSLEHRKAWGDLTTAIVPAGTSSPAATRELDDLDDAVRRSERQPPSLTS